MQSNAVDRKKESRIRVNRGNFYIIIANSNYFASQKNISHNSPAL